MAKWTASVEEVLLIACRALVSSGVVPPVGTGHQELTDAEYTTLTTACDHPGAWLGDFSDPALLSVVRHASDQHYKRTMEKLARADHDLWKKPDIIGDRQDG